MRARVVGSVLVVVCSLVPTIIGGPVFALFLAVLGVAGYSEYLMLAERVGARRVLALNVSGSVAIAAMSAAALLEAGTAGLFIVAAFTVSAPLVTLLRGHDPTSGLTSWALASSGAFYLGLPIFAAMSIRGLPGPAGATWPIQVELPFTQVWDPAPKGLGWTLMVILVIWTSDSVAYLAGRALGRRKLAPAISPGKTVEGSLAGLVGSAVVGALVFAVFGLGALWLGAVVGAGIGVTGQAGDLAESFFKRQAGVKDSGSLISGHGGILDRIDALLFAFPAAYIVTSMLERLGHL